MKHPVSIGPLSILTAQILLQPFSEFGGGGEYSDFLIKNRKKQLLGQQEDV